VHIFSLVTSDSLIRLGRALADFVDVRRALDEALQLVPVRQDIRHRVGALAEDLISAGELLIESHQTASLATDRSTELLALSRPWPEPPTDVRESDDPEAFKNWALAHLPTKEAVEQNLAAVLASLEVTRVPDARAKIAYKVVFFTVSALQDALYGAFLEARGDKAGAQPRMYKGVDDGKPLRSLLEERRSGYPSWFLDWRTKRNEVKEGVSFAITGHPEFGITFTSASEGGGVVDCSGARSVYASDVAHAVEASTELATLVEEVARSRGEALKRSD
jgi:hypothetical protein